MIVGPLFTLLRDCTKPIIILQGGGDAGKTITTLQYFAIDSIERPRTLTTITGSDLPNLKGGALRSWQNYVVNDPQIEPFIRRYNQSEHVYYFTNGSIVEFKSFADEKDARGSERDNLFVNEMQGIPYSMWWQLERKTRRKTIGDYNPTTRFYVHDKILPGEGQEKKFRGKVQRFIVDHRHNPFLRQEDHDNYESIGDPELHRVYARGLTGAVKGLVFGHFKELPEAQWPQMDRIGFGIDYGYSVDESAIVKVGVLGRQRYIKELAYQTAMGAEAIFEVITANGYNGAMTPIYSEADPNMINQLRQLGLECYPAIKGPGSKYAGVSKVRGFECFYEGENLKNELSVYKFITAQDLVTGKEVLTNETVDGHDHLCDALRYFCYTDQFKNRTG